jgi:hypothetical protein
MNRQAGNEDVMCECCWAIRNLVYVETARDRMMAAKGIDTIISVLTTGTDNELLVGETIRAMISMITSEEDPILVFYFDQVTIK